MYINLHILSSPELYKELCNLLPSLLKQKYIKNNNDIILKIRNITYDGWHRRNFTSSDRIFMNYWNNLDKDNISECLIKDIAKYYLEHEGKKISIKLKKFDEWQTWLTMHSALPIIAYKAGKILYKHHHLKTEQTYRKQRLIWLESLLGSKSILTPQHILLDNYINQNRLTDIHIHLNGTTSLESLWNYALSNPNKIEKDLNESKHKEHIKLLYTNNIFYSISEYKKLLYIARALRITLLAWIENEDLFKKYKNSLIKIIENKYINYKNHYADFDYFLLEKKFISYNIDKPNYRIHLEEINLQLEIIHKLKKEYSTEIDICFLLYIICINCFQRILVQPYDKYGFDQFQKYADVGTRESIEKDYTARFFQLHGSNNKSDLINLEGRFAPKTTLLKNENILYKILKGFYEYTQKYGNNKDYKYSFTQYYDINDLAKLALNRKPNFPNLTLIAHFIKKRWSFYPSFKISQKRKIFTGYHFKELRESLDKNSDLLLDLMSKHPMLRYIITGIDAAANELDTPPEVFSTLYRKCRNNGIENFTYHVGEDFEHLLSGIRFIYDAVFLLGLKIGDRLGHATAIGISPYYWINNMPHSIYIRQGEWLENLLFLRHIIININNNNLYTLLSRIESEIAKLALSIFHDNSTDDHHTINFNELQDFFSNRDLDPLIVKKIINNEEKFFTRNHKQEYLLVKKRQKKFSTGIFKKYLIRRWFDFNVIQKYEEKIEIKIEDFISAETLLLAQQYMQSVIAEKQIILETLPTSNVRISYYDNMYEHHIFRWLQIPQRTFPGDTPMLITIGSDDPGIFVTDIRSELYHIFSILINKFDCSPEKALEFIARLNENSSIFKFKPNNYLEYKVYN